MIETDALQLADVIRQTAFEAHTFLRHGHNEKVYEPGPRLPPCLNREHAMLINFGAPKIQFRKYIFRNED